MQLRQVDTLYNLGEEVTYHRYRGRIAAIHATSIVGRIGQKDDVRYDIDIGKGMDQMVEGAGEAMVKRVAMSGIESITEGK